MNKYSYIARTKDAAKETGVVEATSQSEAVTMLQQRELVVISIIPIGQAASKETKKKSVDKTGARKFRHKGAKSADLVIFARQLSMLLGAGVSLMKSLTVTQKQVDSKQLYDAIVEMYKDMEGGKTFKDALTKHKNIFNEFWLYLVETGEASGNLPKVLDHLANYLEERQAFKTKIISALMYPSILFLVAIGAVLFFVMKIVPTFTGILTSMNVELPVPTQIIIGISNFLTTKFHIIVIVVVAGVFLYRKFRKVEKVRTAIEVIQLKTPIFGDFFRFMMIESFSTTMSILIESGVPIIYALDISERSQPSKTMQGVIADVKASVREGKSFATPLDKIEFFPPMVIQMISTGEEIGELSNMFARISKYYRSYLEAFVSRLTALFEPLMIVFMGVIIGAMVIAIFLPIFSLATGAG